MTIKQKSCKFHGVMSDDGDFRWKAKKGSEKMCKRIVEKQNPIRGTFYKKREDKSIQD